MRDIIEDVNKIYGLDHDQVNSLSDQVKERIMSAQFKEVNLLDVRYLRRCLKRLKM